MERIKRVLRMAALAGAGWMAFTLVAGCAPGGLSAEARRDKEATLELSRMPRSNALEWIEIERIAFDDPAALERFVQVFGVWTIRGGKLVAVEGQRERAIMLTHSGQGTPIRIAFNARLGEHPQGDARDITVLVGATADDKFFVSGYTLTTGSYRNNATCFYRQGRRLARTEFSPLETRRTYRVAIEVNDGHLRYWLDDRIILEAWDANPLPPDPNRWIGLRTWDIDMEIDDFRIYRGQRPAPQE